MTSPPPDRSIGGLRKRVAEPDLSGMLARNRPPAPEPPPAAPKPATSDKKTETGTGRTRKTAAPAKKTSPPRSTAAADVADSPKTQVTTYMSTDVRNRARAAFKATAHLENDRNWSAFIEAAVLAETERREREHNEGERFPGGETSLSPGRPIS